MGYLRWYLLKHYKNTNWILQNAVCGTLGYRCNSVQTEVTTENIKKNLKRKI